MTESPEQALRAAIASHKAGRLEEAAERYREILATEPGNSAAAHPLGVILLQAGRFEEAASLLGRVVAAVPLWAEAQNNYGVALRELGRLPEAIAAFRAAVSARSTMFDAHNNLAEALLDTEAYGPAIDASRVAHRIDPTQVAPLILQGVIQLYWQDFAAAIEALNGALERDPTNTRAAGLLRASKSRLVEGWHFAMVNETARNDAYDAAIRRAVKPDSLVLEIGTGAGLLAMMAARAGAGQVITCEVVGPLAAKAREIIAHNGYADRVTVHHMHSDQLKVGVELPRRANVLVSEIFDSSLLGEGVISALEDAHARLIEPGATIVPRAATSMVELAGGTSLTQLARVGNVAGFDLAPFNDFAPERLIFDGSCIGYDRFSDPVAAIRFDFREGRHPSGEHALDVTVTRSGVCLGVVQWIRLELDDTTFYENRPGAPESRTSPWLHAFYSFENPVHLQAGQHVQLFAGHSGRSLYFRLANIPKPT